MSEAQVSSEFEYSASFLKILIPGITISTLASFLLVQNDSIYISFFKKIITDSIWAVFPIGAIFLIISIIFGLFLSILNIHLTGILEGYFLEGHKKNIFIGTLRDWLHKRQWNVFDRYRTNFGKATAEGTDSIEKDLIYREIYLYFSHCLYESFKNPNIDKDVLNDNLKKCILPTKLGNVFKSMEIYPGWKYGMDGVFFWTRIQLLMSEEQNKTMDKLRAFVDMFVELTWIFFFAGIIYLLTFAYNEKYIYSFAFFIIFLLLSLFSYNMTVLSALKFGIYVRSIFDLYREELWNKIKNKQFKTLNSLPERERWDNVFKYLWFCNVIQCPKCGKFYESAEKHDCHL